MAVASSENLPQREQVDILFWEVHKKDGPSMEQKRAISSKLAAKYHGCRKRNQRSEMLQQVMELTDYRQHYAAWVLRNIGKDRFVKTPTGQPVRLVVEQNNTRRPTVRARTYDESVRKVVVHAQGRVLPARQAV